MKKEQNVDSTNDKEKEFKPNRATRRQNGQRNKRKSKRNRFDANNSSGSNDPAWYSQSPELLRDSASIPFSWPVGIPLRTNSKMVLDNIPGVCALRVVPTVGTSLNSNSPVNVASSAIYSWVRHANSGHANYEAPDLMIYLLAMSNVYSFIVWMQRIYGYVTLYDQRNRYLGRGIAAADGVDFDSIRDNLANYRYFLNAYINKVASLAVPATMPIFSRLAFLYSNIYCEGPSVKDQMYMYTPNDRAWYKFVLDETTGAGKLELSSMVVAGSFATFSEIVTYANSLFNAIWEQEDFGIMSGDIIKAYDGNVIKLSSIPEVMNFVPVYDAMVLHQIKNAKLAGDVSLGPISQSSGIISHTIIIRPAASANSKAVTVNYLNSDKVLSTDFDNPGPEVVIESTRLMPAYDAYAGVIQSGTEILMGVTYWYYDNNGVLSKHDDILNSHNYYTATGGDSAFVRNEMLCSQIISNFKYHPEVMRFGIASDNTVDLVFKLWDVDNYAVLSNETLIKLHETALLSLFAVPAISKIS
jgi:hypothetical protein